MAELRVVVTFPGNGWPSDDQTTALTDLQQRLKEAMGPDQRLSRLPSLGLPGQQGSGSGGPKLSRDDDPVLRVFLLELPDDSGAGDALRAIGGWYMRHPPLQLSLKADGPGGGVNLKLSSFSSVAYAQAAQRINDMLSE